MLMHRRRLLQVTGAGCALLALPSVAGAANTALCVHQVQDAVALPAFAAGDLVVADTAITQFSGAGLYLYPAWGQPRLYRVRAAVRGLEFRNPGTGQLLWTQSAELDAAFAGRALEGPEIRAFLADYPVLYPALHPALAVPALPFQA